jgi:Zn-finger nucleic acid-binding protein
MRTEDQVAAMQCPVVPLSMSDRQGIEIDYCPQCRGVWLDRGELDKIVERSAPQGGAAGMGSAPRPAPAYAEHGGQQDSGYGQARGYGSGAKPHKRKKSFFEEIFD